MGGRAAVPSTLAVVFVLAIACSGGGPTPRAAPPDVSTTSPAGSPVDSPVGAAESQPDATPGGTPVGPPLATGPPGTGAPTPGDIAEAWEARAPAPLGLTEVTAATHDGRIWVAGGLALDGSGSTVVQIYDLAADTWADGPRLPEPVHHSALVSTGTELLLLGGYVGSGFQTPTATVRRLSPDAAAWLDGTSLPQERAAGAAAFDGARIVYAGGVGPGGVSDAVFALQADGWQTVGRLSTGREHLAATSDGEGRVWFLGGRVGGLDSNLAAVDIVEGERVGALVELPTARGGVAAFWHERTGACLVGGEGPNGTFAEVECAAADGTVKPLSSLAVPRHGLGAAVLDGTAYVLLGGPQPGLTVSDTVEALELDP
jgi:hypothetical protein